MSGLMIRMSIGSILLVEKLITNYMKENNITDINLVDEKVIQKKYDEIMKKYMWEDPEGYINDKYPSIKCPQCEIVTYNTNDIAHKYCGNCHEYHEHMNLEK